MYYKGVNRGLAFTKPGVYAFGLVLLLGLLAVASGISGLFVFLSVGLGGFIISGLLSEQAMKSCSVRSVAASLVDADAPFEVGFTVANTSSWFTTYSMRGLFLLQPPPFRLIAREPVAVAGVRMARVPPASTLTFIATSAGMPRGDYRRLLAMQLTTFPFGILEKFKLVHVPASIIVAPAVDAAFLDEMRALIRSRVLAEESEREFFGHRPYVAPDSLKHVDWKKSAARPARDWVIKQYRAPATLDPLVVDAPLAYAASLADAAAYERYWSRVRTVLKVLEEAQRGYVVDFGDGRRLGGYAAVLQQLAALPAFSGRSAAPTGSEGHLASSGATAAAPRGATLQVRLDDCSWGPSPRSRGVPA